MAEITVRTDEGREEPVYRQVARQIREMVAHGELPAGYRLPAVRTLASDLGVNLNTVARAYRLLEKEGFVSIRGRSRVEVSAPRERGGESTPMVPSKLLEALKEVLARLRQAGLSAVELRAVVMGEISSMSAGNNVTEDKA